MRGRRLVSGRRAGLSPAAAGPSRATGFVLMLALAALVGSGLTWGLLGGEHAAGPWPGSRTVGPWTAEPFGPPATIDRYARAVVARLGVLPLGPGEGLTFRATADADGRTLDGRCRYRIGPVASQARWWTLALYGPDGAPPAMPGPHDLAGEQGSGTTIEVGGMPDEAPTGSPDAPLAGAAARLQAPPGAFVAVLRLYEPTLGFGPGPLDGVTLPAIAREGCS